MQLDEDIRMAEALSATVEPIWRMRLWERAPRTKALTRELLAMVGDFRGRRALYLSPGQAELGLLLQRQGGDWDFAHVVPLGAPRARTDSSSSVACIEPGHPLPFQDGAYDLVVLIDLLHAVPNGQSIVAECHRVLKTDGKLVIQTLHTGVHFAMRTLDRIAGRSHSTEVGCHGYNQARLFELLKDGFDLEAVRCYSKYFLEVADALFERMQRAILPDPLRAESEQWTRTELGEAYEKALKWSVWTYPARLFAGFLDLLCPFIRGRRLLARANRRSLWRPRRAPRLSDGRSIADAAINTKIGSAAPF